MTTMTIAPAGYRRALRHTGRLTPRQLPLRYGRCSSGLRTSIDLERSYELVDVARLAEQRE
jgi:hypothetical protein